MMNDALAAALDGVKDVPDRAALAQVLADAYGPVGLVDEMSPGHRQTFLDMADAAIEYFAAALKTAKERTSA